MSQVFSIGLTGGIGCGKSTVGGILKELGLRHLDTDLVARDVVAKGSPGLKRVAEHFGESILGPEGHLNREALGKIVFSDTSQKKILEEILHPLIWNQVEDFLHDCRESESPSVVEVPLLFENERGETFTSVWVVSSSKDVQKKRLFQRNGWSDDEIEARIAAQMPLSEKIKRADTVLDNSGDLAALVAKTKKALSELTKASEHGE